MMVASRRLGSVCALFALPLLVTMGCKVAPESPVRDVRPTTLQAGDRMLVEGLTGAFATDMTTEVVLEGVRKTVLSPAARKAAGKQNVPQEKKAKVSSKRIKTEKIRIALPARAVSPERVIVDIPGSLEDTFGGHTQFDGQVSVVQTSGHKDVPPRTLASSAKSKVHLDLFPPSFRKVAASFVYDQYRDSLFSFLGADFVETPRGVYAKHVVESFSWNQFISAYDTPPLDARVEWEREARPKGASERIFRRVDANHDNVVTRNEAEEAERVDGPAAQAGLRTGDLVVSAEGKPLKGLDSFLQLWSQDGATVPVVVLRGTERISLQLPRYGAPAGIPQGFLLAGLLVAVGLLVLLPVGPMAGFIVVWERKISGRMQSRVGPNRVGPQGWLQWLADGVKLIIKEDLVPTEADPILFKLAPYFAFVGVFLTFVVLPISQTLVVADLPIGLLYLLSVTSLVVVSIVMGGWASNSKWSLLGGMRSAAQIISYELPASVALLTVATMTGSLSLQTVVRNQGGMPWEWNLFANPMAFVCFFIYFISALAEGNRTPFDLPEAESELVSGYNTEYSGFRFSIFPMVEWVNLFVISAVVTTVFLGGWGVPGISPELVESAGILELNSLVVLGAGMGLLVVTGLLTVLFGKPSLLSLGFTFVLPVMIGASYLVDAYGLAAVLVFGLKVTSLVFVIIWIRWTLPRFRVDQMMNMCWKYFIPISFACFLGTTVWTWFIHGRPEAEMYMKWAMFLTFGVGLSLVFIKKVLFNLRSTRLLGVKDQVDFNLFY